MDNIIAAIFAGLLGGIGVELIRGVFTRKQLRAQTAKLQAETANIEGDTTDVITRAAMALIQPLEDRVTKLEKKNVRFANRIFYLMGGIDTLMRQLAANGHVPDWQPNDWNPNEDKP